MKDVRKDKLQCRLVSDSSCSAVLVGQDACLVAGSKGRSEQFEIPRRKFSKSLSPFE